MARAVGGFLLTVVRQWMTNTCTCTCIYSPVYKYTVLYVCNAHTPVYIYIVHVYALMYMLMVTAGGRAIDALTLAGHSLLD